MALFMRAWALVWVCATALAAAQTRVAEAPDSCASTEGCQDEVSLLSTRKISAHARTSTAQASRWNPSDVEEENAANSVDKGFGSVSCGPEWADCKMSPPRCWSDNTTQEEKDWLYAFAGGCGREVCHCKPNAGAKRMTQVALMGVLALASSPAPKSTETLEVPQCGSTWSKQLVSNPVDLSSAAKQQVFFGTEYLTWRFNVPAASKWADSVEEVQTGIAETIVYRSADQILTEGGPPEKVCMIVWKPTSDFADWKANFWSEQVDFAYAPAGSKVKIAAGYGAIYDANREDLYTHVQESCCTASFTAAKFVVAGHSMGGGMALVNALDIAWNWKCAGRDLSRHNVAVVTFAHAPKLHEAMLSEVFSGTDPASSLAGSIVTIGAENDYVANGMHLKVYAKDLPGELQAMVPDFLADTPLHPAMDFCLPCRGLPRRQILRYGWKTYQELPNKVYFSSSSADYYCHGLYVYLPETQKTLKRLRWGSSCPTNQCGDPLEQLYKQQEIVTGNTRSKRPSSPGNCSYSLKHNMCDCEYADCWKMTEEGWCSP